MAKAKKSKRQAPIRVVEGLAAKPAAGSRRRSHDQKTYVRAYSDKQVYVGAGQARFDYLVTPTGLGPRVIRIEDDQAGRCPSLTAGQIKRGRSLLRERRRNGPHEFAFKIEAVQWLRKEEQGLRIDPLISDRTVDRHIVTPLWRKKRKQKRTK
jgi:hypothetical protein